MVLEAGASPPWIAPGRPRRLAAAAVIFLAAGALGAAAGGPAAAQGSPGRGLGSAAPWPRGPRVVVSPVARGLRIEVQPGGQGRLPCRGLVALGLVGLSRPGGGRLVAGAGAGPGYRHAGRRGTMARCPATPEAPRAFDGTGAFALENVGWVRSRSIARLWMNGQAALPAVVRLLDAAPGAGEARPGAAAAMAKSGPGAGDVFSALLRRSLINGAALPPMAPGGEVPVAEGLPPELPSTAAARLYVAADGPVLVTFEALVAAGWPPAAVDVRRLGLASAGRPVPFSALDGGDGGFGPGDAVEFLGRAMTGPYTRENVYWLQAEGGAVAYDEARVEPRPDGSEAAPRFGASAHFEVDSVFVQSAAGRNAPDRWLWGPAVSTAGRVVAFDLPGLAAGAGGARLELGVLAYDTTAGGARHRLRVVVNGRARAAFSLAAGEYARLAMGLGAEVLAPGTNRLTLATEAAGGQAPEVVYLDAFDVAYEAAFRPRGDLARFAAVPGAQGYTVGPFSSPAVRLFDMTDPLAPVALGGFSIAPSGDGGYDVSFADAAGGRRYLAYGPAALRAPRRVEMDSPSSLRRPGRGADWLAIAHPDLVAAVEPLADRRRDQGLKTAIVSVTDVYDEFSAGVFDPRGLRDFVAYALANWRPAPTYVVLVGDAALDHRNEYGTAWRDMVPSVQVDLDSGAQATSDLFFATVAGDDALADVLIGRIPAITPGDVATAVDKIAAFEDAPPGPWRRRATFVAGSWRGAGANEAGAEALIASLPAAASVGRIWGRRYPTAAAMKGALAEAMSAGTLDVSYVGHGNAGLWKGHSVGRVLDSQGVAGLVTNFYPILTTATCRNGFIDAPYAPVSLAEAWLLTPGAGGAAAWSPSGEEYTVNHVTLLGPFHRRLHTGGAPTLGAAAQEATLVAFGVGAATGDVIRQFVLVGDPAMALPRPPGAPERVHLPWVVRRPARRP